MKKATAFNVCAVLFLLIFISGTDAKSKKAVAKSIKENKKVVAEITKTGNENEENEKDKLYSGKAAYDNGDFEKAKIDFGLVLKNEPDNGTALAYLGSTYYKLGDFNEAINAYNKLLGIDPNRKELYYDLGLAYVSSDKLKEALAAFEKAQEYFEGNSRIMFQTALANYKAGDLDETIKKLKTVIEKDPGFGVDPYFYLGRAYFYKGMADEASSYFNKVIQMSGGTNWEKTAREFIDRIEASKPAPPKLIDLSLYTNVESDTNAGYASSPSAADADLKTTIYASLGYKPQLFNTQLMKFGYSFYSLGYSTHTSSNFLGHMAEISLNASPTPGSLLTVKLNGNYYLLAGSPYMVDIPLDLRYTFKMLPGQGMWTILNGSYAKDTYASSSYKNKDCTTMTAGIKQYLSDLFNVGYEFKTSIASGEPSTKTEDFSYSSNEINFGYVQPLPMDFSVSVNGSYLMKNYKVADSYTIYTTPTKRTDTVINVSATLSKTIIHGIGALLKAGYYLDTSNLTASKSAVGFGTYSSNTVSLGFSKAF
ncbi:MAG: tetratricopeptide repeat protein [Candidatus Margulisiibacteriota bacterium]